MIVNKFTSYTVVSLMESAQNCVDMLLKAEVGKFQFQTTNFDSACFADIMIPLNQELINRGIEPIKMPHKVYQDTLEMKQKDHTYEYSVADFKKYIKEAVIMIKPVWFRDIPDESSITNLTTADKVLGG